MAKLFLVISIVVTLLTIALAFQSKTRVDSLQTNIEEVREKASAEKAAARAELEKAQQSLDAANQTIEEQKTKLAGLETDLNTAKQDLEKAAADVTARMAQMAALEREMQERMKMSVPASPESNSVETAALREELQRSRAELMEVKALAEAQRLQKVVPAEGVKALVKVFYATDRNPTGSDASEQFYGPARGDGTLRYGTCLVSIPRDHKMGDLESPSILRLEFKQQASKHVILSGVTPLEPGRYYDQLKSSVGEAESKELFVFVHGFANTFAYAARKAAQLSYDLGYKGVPLIYSWPSKGEGTPAAYRYDETNIDWTFPHLKQFLEELAERSGAERIHLVAHSMGNRVLGNAISALGAGAGGPPAKPIFDQVVLTAPDVDAEVFRRDLVPAFAKLSQRVTLYSSSKDRALQVSKKLHGDFPRAGDSHPAIVVADKLDSIDVSAIQTYFLDTGHSYFGDNRSIISDLFLLFRDGSPPAKRNLLPQPAADPRHWVFRP